MILLLCAFAAAGCQATGTPATSSDELPKGTALPPPEHDVLPNQSDASPE